MRHRPPDRPSTIDELFAAQITGLAELAHIADAAYWTMFKPVIKGQKSKRCLRTASGSALLNSNSMQHRNTIGYLTATESLQSRWSTARFLMGKLVARTVLTLLSESPQSSLDLPLSF